MTTMYCTNYTAITLLAAIESYVLIWSREMISVSLVHELSIRIQLIRSMHQNRRDQKYEAGDIDQFSYKYIYSLFFKIESLDMR